MTPLSVMLAELWQVNPSFVIVYDEKTRKTCLMEGDIEVSSGDHIDSAILRAWNKVFGIRKGDNDSLQSAD